MLNFGCQPCSLYREDFFCSSLKLFGSIRIAYGFYSQTLAGYNNNPHVKRAIQQEIENPLAQQILSGSLLPEKPISVDYVDGKIVAKQ